MESTALLPDSLGNGLYSAIFLHFMGLCYAYWENVLSIFIFGT